MGPREYAHSMVTVGARALLWPCVWPGGRLLDENPGWYMGRRLPGGVSFPPLATCISLALLVDDSNPVKLPWSSSLTTWVGA